MIRVIRTVHRELPLPAGMKFEAIERICETIRTPPACKARRVAERGEDRLRRGRDLSKITNGRQLMILSADVGPSYFLSQ